MLGTLAPWLHQYGVVAVFVILTLESFGVPLPGESLLLVAAILAGRGDLSFSALFFAAWAGAVIGDNIGYLIGRLLGRKLLGRYGGKIGLTAERLRKVEAVFARYGPLTVGFARFLNVLRQLNGIVAGTLEMDWRRFLVFNAVGGALWVLIWTTIGFYLGVHGADIKAVVHRLRFLGTVFVLIALIVILAHVYRRRIFARLRRGMAGKARDEQLPASVQGRPVAGPAGSIPLLGSEGARAVSPMKPSANHNAAAAQHQSMHDYWGLFLAEGFGLSVLGLAAIIVPPIAGLFAGVFLGWLFLIAGILGLVATLRARQAPGFRWSLLSALVAMIAGGVLLWNLLQGVVTLTYVLTAFFIVDGILIIILAITHRRELSGKWEWMLVNGVIDLILAGILISGLPGALIWAFGLLVGIDLMFGGASLIAVALEARK
ncbi:MAG: VTT domain-containing protein [Terriglobales bacterium]